MSSRDFGSSQKDPFKKECTKKINEVKTAYDKLNLADKNFKRYQETKIENIRLIKNNEDLMSKYLTLVDDFVIFTGKTNTNFNPIITKTGISGQPSNSTNNLPTNINEEVIRKNYGCREEPIRLSDPIPPNVLFFYQKNKIESC